MIQSSSIIKIFIAFIVVTLIGVGIYFLSAPEKPREKVEENLPLFEVEGEDMTSALPRNAPPSEDDEVPEGFWK